MGSDERKRTYTLEEVRHHKTADDLWIVHNGRVYDVTSFQDDHPGGPDLLLMQGGKDATEIMADKFEHEHSSSAYTVLKEFYIGDLEGGHECPTIVADDADPNFLDLSRPLWPQIWSNNFTREYYVQQVHIARHTKDGSSPPLFGNFLEIFTLTPWFVIPLVWGPVVLLWTYVALQSFGPVLTAVLFAIGLVHWTFIEYCVHRFVFHIDENLIDHPLAFSLHFVNHGMHHFLPMDRYRLVMPPALFTVLMVPIFGMYNLVASLSLCCAVGAGTVMGYIFYDLTHYFLHHGRPFGAYLRMMKTYHLNHHYMNFSRGFGITSKVWDVVFGTELIYPMKAKAA